MHHNSNGYKDETEAEPERDMMKKPIGEKTSIQLGFLIAVLGVMGAGFCASIWWGATISSKLDSLLQKDSARDQIMAKMSATDDMMDRRILSLEQLGSPALIPRIKLLEEEYQALKRDMELHKLTASEGKKLP